jgi:regulator of RNase E activity RraA
LDELRGVTRSALVADALDSLGLRAQCLPWDIVPLTHDALLVGRAYAVSCEPVDRVPEVPYAGLLRALDGIGPDEVFVISTDRSDRVAVWGELVSTACVARGAAGALTDGLVRDSARLRALGRRFPVFSRGTVPYDINGRFEITGVGGTLRIGDVEVRHGDLIVGDCDGVAAVPVAVEREVIDRVREKVSGEDKFRRAVEQGMKPSAAYAEYKVL